MWDLLPGVGREVSGARADGEDEELVERRGLEVIGGRDVERAVEGRLSGDVEPVIGRAGDLAADLDIKRGLRGEGCRRCDHGRGLEGRGGGRAWREATVLEQVHRAIVPG